MDEIIDKIYKNLMRLSWYLRGMSEVLKEYRRGVTIESDELLEFSECLKTFSEELSDIKIAVLKLSEGQE